MTGLRPAHLASWLVALGFAAAPGVQASEPPAGPITADQAVAIALERNHDVAIAAANYEAARGQSWQALRGVLPSVSSSAAYTHSKSVGQTIVGNRPVTGEAEVDFSSINVTLDQSVFSWSNIRSLESARASARSSSGLSKAEELNVALNVRAQYYELLKALRLAVVRDEAVKLSEDQLRRAETLFELGSVARNDVLQARVNLQQARLAQITARNKVEVERGRLAQLLGLPVDSPLEIAQDLEVEAAELDSTAVLKEALAARPDVGAAHETVRSSSASLGSARAGHFPELFGRVSWSWTYRPGKDLDPFSGQVVENDTHGWSAATGVSVNLFDGMAVEGQVKSAKWRLAADRSRLRQLELVVALEVKEALLGVRESRQSIEAAREGVSLAEENLKLAQERYDVGSGTILELNAAQVSLIESRSSLVDAQAALLVALARLDKARGAGLP